LRLQEQSSKVLMPTAGCAVSVPLLKSHATPWCLEDSAMPKGLYGVRLCTLREALLYERLRQRVMPPARYANAVP